MVPIEYKLICADNLALEGGTVKATYLSKQDAITALNTEITLARAEHHIDAPYVRFIDMGNDGVAVDFGSWSDFIGLTGVTIEDFQAA